MTINIGIVGCGEIAGYLHAPAIKLSKSCRLIAAVDMDLERAKRLAADFGIGLAADDIQSIADKVDAVVLATPPHVKTQLAVQAASLGLDLICEKPLANSVEECEEIADAAQKYGRKIAVFHQFRFWPNRIKIQQMIEQGLLSRPINLSIEMGRPYSWASVSGYTVRKGMVPGGVLINAGIHPLDTLISWFGDPIISEYSDDAYGGLESNARISMKFNNEVEGKFRISRTCNLKNCITLRCRDQTINMNNSDPFHYDVLKRSGEYERTQVADSTSGFLGPAADLYDDFAQSIESDREPRVTVAEGTRVIRWIEDCYAQKARRRLPGLAPIPGFTW